MGIDDVSKLEDLRMWRYELFIRVLLLQEKAIIDVEREERARSEWNRLVKAHLVC